jgi:hypothetical protein
MSDTPETDLAIKASGGDWSPVLRVTSQRLERQRDEAREAIRALAEHGESEIQRITKERDEAREKLENEMKWHHQTHAELIQAQCKLLDIEYDKLKS